jgi:hypothetical protein
MTEDDTFERLRRPSYRQMANIVMNFNIRHNGQCKEELWNIMISLGWTREEYRQAWLEHNKLKD